MSMMNKLIRYPEERALEDAAYAQRVVPTRIFALLLPVWRVEVEATITEGEPYELIDRYLERGIAEGGLDTAADLAGFLALDEVLVDRALRFLTAIGHLTDFGGRLGLTDLGLRSVRDQVRYVVTRQDRRTLYFDAFGCRPLTRPYYDARTVTFLSGQESREVAGRTSGPRFQQLVSLYGFRQEALTELARHTDRDHYNLPEGIDAPRSIGHPETVFLPAYVVRAVNQNKRVRYLTYTQAGDEADPDITQICEQTPDMTAVFETEERDSPEGLDMARVSGWLAKRDLDGHRPVRTQDGMWQITFSGSAFDGDGQLPISKLGSFVLLGNDFFHVWCTDQRVRRRALLERMDAYLRVRTRLDPMAVEEQIGRIARQLELGAIDLLTLSKMATKAGKQDLAAQLGRLA